MLGEHLKILCNSYLCRTQLNIILNDCTHDPRSVMETFVCSYICLDNFCS